MKAKKILTGVLSLAILSLTGVSSFEVQGVEKCGTVETIQPGIENSQEVVPAEEKQMVYFASFGGKVKSITEREGIPDTKLVLVVNEEGHEVNFVVTKDTYIVNNEEIKVGSVVEGFYDLNVPTILIYPPQYKALVMAVRKEGENVKFDRFDENLVSSDNMLKLNIGKDTEIVTEDGTAYKDSLGNKNLIVIYGISTKSIPAQTTPTKIIVLSDPISSIGESSSIRISINNKELEGLYAYKNDQGMVMVPLRAVSEALGLDVKWDHNKKSAQIGTDISLSINKDSYTYGNKETAQLGTAPVLDNEKTYVPISFFKEVAHTDGVEISQ